MSLVPMKSKMSREVSYEFMNRQMVWHAFTVCVPTSEPIATLICVRQGILALSTPLDQRKVSSSALHENYVTNNVHPTPAL